MQMSQSFSSHVRLNPIARGKIQESAILDLRMDVWLSASEQNKGGNWGEKRGAKRTAFSLLFELC